MKSRAHPLRRRYSLELALGVLAVLGAALVLSRPGGRSRATSRAQPTHALAPAERAPATIAAHAASATAERAEPTRATEPALETPGRSAAPPDAPAARPLPAPTPPAGELEVLVRDERGRPVAGISLGLETEPPMMRWSSTQRVGPGSPSQGGSVTGPDGRARMPLDWFVAPAESEPERRSYVLRANVPLRQRPSIDFGSRPPGPGLVVLTLPLAGRVHVHVLDAEGAPIEDGAGVYAVLRGGGADGVHATAEVRAGLAELPWIPLDATLELRGSYDDKRADSTRLVLAGPTLPDETVEADLRLGASWPVLRFRVLDERGAPLASARLALRVSLPPLSPQIADLKSSPEGWVELQLLERQLVRAERLLELAAEQPVPRWGELVLPYELVHGAPTKLGDIVLRPGPGWR